MIEPIKPETNSVTILDQRALPDAVRYWRCQTADDIIAAIQSLAVRGAPLIGIAALYGLWLAALTLEGSPAFWEQLTREKDRIKTARPTAVNLAWAVDRAWAAVSGRDAKSAVAFLRQAADRLAFEERQRNQAIAQYGASLLLTNSRVLTHCNTGSLATVGVGTALGIIREAYLQGRIESVWVDETRPLLQGARLTAWELDQDRIPAKLITDSMAGTIMAQGRVDAVIVGADRIAANGDTANKIGTYNLAVLAHYHHVPFYVAAPLSTVDLSVADGTQIPIEERSHDEIRMIRAIQIAPTDTPVYNPAFDVTPGVLITAIVTDRGVAHFPYQASLSQMNHERNTILTEEASSHDGHQTN